MALQLSLKAEVPELQEAFRINKTMAASPPRPHIVPTEDVAVVIGGIRERRLVEARWGLFPFWAKDSVVADYEALMDKPIFRQMLNRQRCVVPCTAFYEVNGSGKQAAAVRFSLPDSGLFGIAGLYEERMDTHGEIYRTCTIVTSGRNRRPDGFGMSMPVIVDPDETGDWLLPAYAGHQKHPAFFAASLGDRLIAVPAAAERAMPAYK